MLHYSALNTDRHKSVTTALAIFSVSGSITGTFFLYDKLLFTQKLDSISDSRFFISLLPLFLIFIMGFFRIGKILIPALMFSYCAAVSAYFFTIDTSNTGFFLSALIASLSFVLSFLLGCKGLIVSGNYPITISGKSYSGKFQRNVYLLEYIVFNIIIIICCLLVRLIY